MTGDEVLEFALRGCEHAAAATRGESLLQDPLAGSPPDRGRHRPDPVSLRGSSVRAGERPVVGPTGLRWLGHGLYLVLGYAMVGALGLFIGLGADGLGSAAAAGFVLYFLAATGLHVRARDAVANLAPVAVLLVSSAATFLASL